MNVIKEVNENLTAILKVQISEADYQETVEKKLSDYRKEAKINGFRPGKAPMGMIKKVYGHYVLVEEINKLVSDSLHKYLVDEKIDILGEPMPNEELQKNIDWTNNKDFEFVYEIGIAPKIELEFNKKKSYDYFKIAVSDEMVNEQLVNIQNRFGKQESAEVVVDGDVIRGTFEEVDAKGKVIEGGLKKENASLLLSVVKDEKIKNKFIGAKVGEVIVYNPLNATENETEVAAMLGVEKTETDKINADYQFTILDILHFEKAELTTELFDKVYGEGVIASEAELKSKIKSDFEERFMPNSDYKFLKDFKDSYVSNIDVQYPESFLKKWLLAINKDNDKITPEQIDTEFPLFLQDLKWQSVKNEITRNNEIKVEYDELKNAAKEYARMQFAQFGLLNPKDEDLENWGNEILKNKEEGQKLYEMELDKKLISYIKSQITIKEKEVTVEEFSKLIEK